MRARKPFNLRLWCGQMWRLIWPNSFLFCFFLSFVLEMCRMARFGRIQQKKKLPGNTSRISGFGAWIHPFRCWIIHWNIFAHLFRTAVSLVLIRHLVPFNLYWTHNISLKLSTSKNRLFQTRNILFASYSLPESFWCVCTCRRFQWLIQSFIIYILQEIFNLKKKNTNTTKL